MKKLILLSIIASLCYGCAVERPEYKGTTESGFDMICIENHIYYQDDSGYNGYLAIKLDDDGKPVKCEIGE